MDRRVVNIIRLAQQNRIKQARSLPVDLEKAILDVAEKWWDGQQKGNAPSKPSAPAQATERKPDRGQTIYLTVPPSNQQQRRNNEGKGKVELQESSVSKSFYEAYADGSGYALEPQDKHNWNKAFRSLVGLENLFVISGEGNKIKSVSPASLDKNMNLMSKGRVTLG